MHKSRFPLVCLLALLPLGCANWNASQRGQPDGSDHVAGESVDDPLQLIAIDFVHALRQIREVPPANTTVQLLSSSRSDPFTQAMRDALQNVNYGIRWAADGVGEHLMQYRHVREASAGGSHRDVYEVAVGRVEMRRSYVLGEGASVKPVTPLYVRGTDASNIVLNDAVFEPVRVSNPIQSELDSGAVVVSIPLKPVVPRVKISASAAKTSRGTLSSENQSRLAVPDEANPLEGLVSITSSAKSLALPLIALPRVENVFELGGSNFEDVLVSHRKVNEQILTFPNDSLRLGEHNKRFIERMVVLFDPESDVFSVIGCSLGPTRIKGGNAALALGRASRVREALLFAGVSQDKILDEGCWAGDSAGNTLPRRGVVVTLNRRT